MDRQIRSGNMLIGETSGKYDRRMCISCHKAELDKKKEALWCKQRQSEVRMNFRCENFELWEDSLFAEGGGEETCLR